MKVYFLCMDRDKIGQLRREGINTLNPVFLPQAWEITRCKNIITDHGPGVLACITKLATGIRFIDVWHGIGYKDISVEYRRLHKDYWRLISPSIWYSQEFLQKRCGFSADKILCTGYGLLDNSRGNARPEDYLKLGLKPDKITILYAPTWNHGKKQFDSELNQAGVLDILARLAQDLNLQIIFRSHLNTNAKPELLKFIHSIPMSEYADTVTLMKLSHILISDWSSIIVDFIAIQKPVIFIDRPNPFAGQQLLNIEERPGDIVRNQRELQHSVTRYVESPALWLQHYQTEISALLDKTHGHYLDDRCCQRIARGLLLEQIDN